MALLFAYFHNLRSGELGRSGEPASLKGINATALASFFIMCGASAIKIQPVCCGVTSVFTQHALQRREGKYDATSCKASVRSGHRVQNNRSKVT